MISLLLLAPLSFASEYIDQNTPESWYHAPELASEIGIKDFKQSPILDKRVEDGELPSVEQRLPEDPPVIEPFEEIGIYGGQAQTFALSLDSYNTGGQGLIGYENGIFKYAVVTPDGNDVVPQLAKGWEYSNDFKEITLYLREGVKWSDGIPFNADDIMYWWEYEANNGDLNPVPPGKWSPPILNVEKIDDLTVRFTYGKAVPNIHLQFALYWTYGIQSPRHYFKQFHPGFRDMEELNQEAKNADFDNWFEYYQYMKSYFHPERETGVMPTLGPFVVKERALDYWIAERNPYFSFVDTEGNQLPYIDKLKVMLGNNKEMLNMKAVTGESNLLGRNSEVPNIPLYLENAKNAGYKVLLWKEAIGSACLIQPNFTHPDPELRTIMHNVKFRQALSLAIDRKEINDKVYFGKAVSRQATVVPTSKYFEPRFAEAYSQYNPEKAKQILDEIGMVDVNGDGYRERPDGKTFNPEMIYVTSWGPITEILEIVKAQFEEIGINLEIKLLGQELFEERKLGSNFDFAYNLSNKMTDIGLKTVHGNKVFSVEGYAGWSQWPAWTHWYKSAGEKGEEPPQKFKEIFELRSLIMYGTDEEEVIEGAKKLLESQAENLYAIGTVGLPPKPVIVKDIYNVPSIALWTDDFQRLEYVRPMQFYMKEAK